MTAYLGSGRRAGVVRAVLLAALVGAGCASPHSLDARPATVKAGAAAATATSPADADGPPWIRVRQIGTAYAGGEAQVEVTEARHGGEGESSVEFGDGGTGYRSAGADMGCEPLHGQGDGWRAPEVLTHVYRYPGTYTVTVTFTPHCGTRRLSPVIGTGQVTVLDGDAPSNGADTPFGDDRGVFCRKASNEYGTPQPPPLHIDCVIQYEDYDGYVTSVVVRWGDGSPDSVWEFPLSECVDPEKTWPRTLPDEDDPDDASPARHLYPAKGIYRAYVTVTSSGCDGKDVQVGTASTRVTVE